MGVEQGLLALIGAADADGYEIEQSLRFNSGDSAYLNRTSAAGNRKTFTASAWVKKTNFAQSGFRSLVTWTDSGGTKDEVFAFHIANASDTVWIFSRTGGTSYYISTSAVLRDPSAWYHLVFVVDTTQATDTNRFKIYVNGELAPIATSAYPPQNYDLPYVNVSGKVGYIGAWYDNPWYYLNGYLAEVNFIDGSALDPTNFGEYDDNGVWRPIKYTGSYTGNSFYLKFASGDGTDSSGLSNTWTANNFTTSGTGTDVMSDTPTTNYATLNPLLYMGTGSTKANGNLQFTGGGTGGPPYNYSIHGTFVLNTGKWYWEVDVTTVGQAFIGIFNTAVAFNGGSKFSGAGPVVYGYDGNYYNETTGVSFGNTYTSGDVISVAVDFDANLIWFGKNGTWQNSGVPASSTNGKSFGSGKTWGVGYLESGSSVSPSSFYVNFGQRAFEYTPPTGFKALNTKNLPAPDIADGSENFNTILWAGNNDNPRTLTGVGFQPDWVWLKDRTQSTNHRLVDVVRGAGKTLKSNNTSSETSSETAGTITAFTSDGFTVEGTSNVEGVNLSGDTYVAWNWKANGSVSADNNTDGSITSTVSANSSAGFSIVTFTGNGTAGATVGHGLGVEPKMLFWKSRNSGTTSDHWTVYHAGMDATAPQNYAMHLNLTNARNSTSAYWNNTAPTSTVFSLGYASSYINVLNRTYVAYCFAEVEGYSKFGSYTGNGSSNGPFVYCGFKPAWIMVKNTTTAQGWYISDNKRDTYNQVNRALFASSSSAESSATTGASYDFLSNGFKPRTSNNDSNGSGDVYIFMAFAENPFGGSGVSPATAR